MRVSSAEVIKKIKHAPFVIWMMLAIVGGLGVFVPSYFSVGNFTNVLVQSSPLLILAFGQTLIILTEGIDLSLGAQVSFVTVIWMFLATMGVDLYLAAAIAVCLAVLAGTVNGVLIAKGGLPPFIATLGVQNVLNSISLLLTAGASIYYHTYTFQLISESMFLFLPLPVWIAYGMFAITWLLLYRTKFGTNIFGLGGNMEALTFAGIDVSKAIIKTYAYAGLLAGIVGILVACRVESGQPTIGNGWEFDTIAATILGGTSFREGKGGIVGTILGVLLIYVIKNGLNVAGVNGLYQNAIIGSVVLTAIVVDTYLNKYRTD
ncbi:MAG: ABC transporter permease [Negativicutes bacterium]|nr:ABC transporter permease [Negativicutes bacterium]